MDLQDLPASCEWSSLRHLTVYNPAPTLTPRMDMFAGLETLRFVHVSLPVVQLRIVVEACPRLTEFWYMKHDTWARGANLDDMCKVLAPVKSLRVAYLYFPYERPTDSLTSLTQLRVLRLSASPSSRQLFHYLPRTLRELQLDIPAAAYMVDEFDDHLWRYCNDQ